MRGRVFPASGIYEELKLGKLRCLRLEPGPVLVLGLGVHNPCLIQILMILEKILQFYAGGMCAQAWPGSNCTPS